MMNRAERIRAILSEQLQPSHLEITDESHKHHGHAGAKPEGETHYHLNIVSDKFNNVSKVKCHQMIYALLEAEFSKGLHALSIDARKMDEGN